jgi:hypothetical protein
MPYAIRLNDVFYTEGTPNPWAFNPAAAKMWDSAAVPEEIVAYWNKVHYERTEVVGEGQRVMRSALGGNSPGERSLFRFKRGPSWKRRRSISLREIVRYD